MSIQAGQTIDRDTLNRAYVSKSATGTQIMAGSLRLLGGIQIDGTTTLGSVTTGTINAGANSITTSGTITAGTFSGSGASLTSLPVNQFGTNRIGSANLPSTTLYTDVVATITTNKTMNAVLYFANGTSYYVDNSANAKFSTATIVNAAVLNSTLTVAGAATFNGNVTLGDAAADTITVIGTPTFKTDVNFANGTTYKIDSTGSATLNNLEVQGEFKASVYNEFPDPLLVSNSTALWTSTKSGYATVEFDSTQTPTGTGAVGSIKITATAADAWAFYDYYFDVNPNEWITFSAYAFATTTGQDTELFIQWLDASKVSISYSYTRTTPAISWTRYSVTAQAPSTARYFRVRVDNNNSGGIMYFSAFQVERGRAMTVFKPYGGGRTSANFFSNGVMLAANNGIYSGYNNDFILKDHTNGAVTLSAAGTNLHLGHQNTQKIWLSANVHDTTGNTKIIDTAGKLYYQGNDIDSRYLKLTGGTVTGATTFSGGVTVSGTATIGTVAASNYQGKYETGMTSFYTNTNSTDSGSWIEMYGYDRTIRPGELALAGNYIAFRTGSTNAAVGTENMRLTTSGLYIGGAVTASRKLHVAGDARVNTTLEVGTGTAANDLVVTSGGAFNWRNTLYSNTAGKVSINQTSNSEHPLHVKSDGSYMGINIQATADTDVSGISFENANGNNTWHIARSGAAAADLIFYSGNTATMSSLTEKVRFNNTGGLVLKNNSSTIGGAYVSNGWIYLDNGTTSLGLDPNEIYFTGVDAALGTIGNYALNLHTNGAARVNIDGSGNTTFYGHIYNSSSHYSLAAVSGRGFRFWNSDSYRIQMSVTSDATHGGTISWVPTTADAVGADYNIYFQMTGNNRGWAFRNDTRGGVNAQITGDGQFHTKKGIRAQNFSMEYNSTEDSLDFIYWG